MYCIVWRHYNADGLTPYVISKFPDQEEVDAQPELAPLLKQASVLRPKGVGKSLMGKDTDKFRDIFNRMQKAGDIITCKVIDIDFNTMEDIIIFKSKNSADMYLKDIEPLEWTIYDTEIILQKEIKELKDLSAFQ
tara:strand:+ start:9356 stop:9760 length:405 start_codon:yes stop_codon:yes gene_type:complete